VRIGSSVVASQAIDIGRERVPAFKVRSRAVFEGEVSGDSIVNDWKRRADGLLLRRTVDTRANVDVIGGGNYDENYALAIVSTAPHT